MTTETIPTPTETETDCIDLRQIFAMQAKLNDFVFATQGLRDPRTSEILTTATIQAESGSIGPNSLRATWFRNYLTAMAAEVEETRELVPWKWWSKSVVDANAAAEELIDILHFWVSSALAIGLDAGKVMQVYSDKYAVNVRRQEEGYVARGDKAV